MSFDPYPAPAFGFDGQIGLSSAASASGVVASMNVEFIRGAFKVYESESLLQAAAPELFADGQIVYCQDVNKLYQIEYIPPTYTPFPGTPAAKTSASFQWPGTGGSGSIDDAIITASVAGNTMTFTKGDGSTFDVTLPGGSGGSGIFTPTGVSGTFETTSSLQISGSLTVTGSSPSINIGTPEGSDNVYSDGYFSTFNENTRLANALDQISEAFADLAPPKAGELTSTSLVRSAPAAVYSGYLAGGLISSDWYLGYLANQLVTDRLITLSGITITSPSPGSSFRAGKKSDFTPNNVLEGGITSSITAQSGAPILDIKALNTGTGTVGNLWVNSLEVYNNLWMKANAQITYAVSDTGSYKFKLSADNDAGETAETQLFFLGGGPDYPDPSISVGTITSGSVTYNALSGIEYLKTATFNIPATGNNLFNPVYNINQMSFTSIYTNSITTGSKASDSPQFGDTKIVEIAPTITAGLSSGQNSPTGTAVVIKPGKTGTYNASYTLTTTKVNSYVSDPSTAINEPFLGESRRYIALDNSAWNSSNPLVNGALQVQNGRLIGGNQGDYTGFSGVQNYYRLFSGYSPGKIAGTFVLSGNFPQISEWNSGGDLEVAIIKQEDITGPISATKIYDLGRLLSTGPVVSNIYGAGVGTAGVLSGAWSFGQNTSVGNSGNLILWIKYSTPNLTSVLTNINLTVS
jgi:hypothetical protein